MGTKSISKRIATKRARRALNATVEGPKHMTGKRSVRVGWGTALRKRDLEGPSYYSNADKDAA